MTLNPTANNWILPIKGELLVTRNQEDFGKARVREQGMKIKIDWEPAATFNMLNEVWWENYFGKMKFADLKVMAELLGVDPYMKSKKIYYVLALSDHYRAHFQ